MSAGAPWSVKGIDPKAREVAKDLARRSGMTLGEWLNRMILEDEEDVPDEVTAEAQFGQASRLRAFAPPGPGAPESLRVAQALERLTDRIEGAETRTSFAISGVERQVRETLARLDTAERAQHMVATRLQEAESREATLAERLRRLEAGPRSAEALRLMEPPAPAIDADRLAETVLERLADRLAQAEAHTTTALGELADSLALLDNRLDAVERRGGAAALEQRFQTLSDSLTRQIDATREEVARKLEAAGTGDVEARLARMADHVRAAETRSRQAVERIGREVLAMADAVNRRLVTSEERSAEAIDLVGTEIARIAGAVEARLARAEHAQATTLDRLTAEVGEATVRFADRMEAAERRSADAIQGVGDQVARLAAQLELRREGVPAEALAVAEPVASDTPDAEDVWEPLTAQAAPEAEVEAQAPDEVEAEAGPQPEAEETSSAAFGPELFSRAEVEPAPEDILAAVVAPRFAPEDLDAAAGFAPIPEPEDDIFAAEVLDEPAAPAEGRPLSTREVIEQARAAARAAQEAGEAAGARPIDVRAKVDRRAASGRLFDGFGQPKARRANSALHTALMVAGGAAFLSVGAAGVVLMERPSGPDGLSPFGAAPRAAVALAPAQPPATAGAEAPDGPVQAVMNDIAARKPGALAKLKAMAEGGDATAQLRLADLYESGEAGVVRNMAEARRWTVLSAEAGLPRAMHNLAIYYFRGDGGPQDLASAALWFRKAAEAGLAESQFNLAVMYQTGSGVQKNPGEALKWYREAAAQGDSQAAIAVEKLAAAVLTPVEAKRALFELGYFRGPLDAQETPDFRAALSNYQRDNGKPVTGQLDQATAALLSAHRH